MYRHKWCHSLWNSSKQCAMLGGQWVLRSRISLGSGVKWSHPRGPWSHCYRLVEHQRACPQLLRVNSVTGRNKVKHGKGQSFHTSDLLKSSCKWRKTSCFFIACPKLYVFLPVQIIPAYFNHFQSLHPKTHRPKKTHITSKSWHLVVLFPTFLGFDSNRYSLPPATGVKVRTLQLPERFQTLGLREAHQSSFTYIDIHLLF